MPRGVHGVRSVTNGTAITVTDNAITRGVDVSLQPVDVAATRPAAPTGLAATVDNGIVTFTWSPGFGVNAAPATSFVIEIGLAPRAVLVTRTSTTMRVSIAGVPDGHFYARVRDVNANGTGAASNDVDFRVADGVGVPSAPTELPSQFQDGRLVLTGRHPSSAPGLSDIALVSIPGPTTTVSFPNIPPGTCYVRLRATVGDLVSLPTPDYTLIVR
jgi:hypothetical protein